MTHKFSVGDRVRIDPNGPLKGWLRYSKYREPAVVLYVSSSPERVFYRVQFGTKMLERHWLVPNEILSGKPSLFLLERPKEKPKRKTR